MNRLQATSRCECQAMLGASLDEKRHVVQGWATHLGTKERAPAHSIHAEQEHFDIGWLCPFCGRNTLRTFFAGALRVTHVPDPVPAADPAPAQK
jgi:hypothetical protein